MKTSPSKLSVLAQSCLLAIVLTGCATDQEKQASKTRLKVEEAKKQEAEREAQFEAEFAAELKAETEAEAKVGG